MTLSISVGNSVWWMVIILCCTVTALLYLLLRRKNEEQKRKAILIIGYVIMVLFYVHRILIFRYDAYVSLYGNGWKRILTDLLPFNLCYLSMVIMIIYSVFTILPAIPTVPLSFEVTVVRNDQFTDDIPLTNTYIIMPARRRTDKNEQTYIRMYIIISETLFLILSIFHYIPSSHFQKNKLNDHNKYEQH